jgi:hypothetical protein
MARHGSGRPRETALGSGAVSPAARTTGEIVIISGVPMASTRSQPMAAARVASATLVLLALLVASGVLLVYAGRHLGFFFDEWNVVLDRRSGGLSTILDAHNGHPLVLPAIVYRVFFELFGLDDYTPYRLVPIALHLVAGAALYVLARRRVGPWAALVPTALLLFLGSGYVDLLWAFQMGYVGSIACGLLALVLLDRRREGIGTGSQGGVVLADVGVCLLLIAAIAWSSIGIAFFAGVAVELALDSRTRRRLWVVAVPVALYGLWYLGYGGGGDGRPQADNVVKIPQYVLDSAAGAVAAIGGTTLTWGPPLLLFAIGALWAVWRAQGGQPPLSPRLAGLTAAVLLNWTLTALTRAQLNEPATSRYVYVGAVFLLLIAVELLRPPRRDLRLAAVAAVLTGAAVISNVGIMRDGQRSMRDTWESVQASLSAIEVAGAATPRELQPEPQRAPQLTAGRYLDAVAADGSPALTPEQLAAEPGPLREQADRVLTSAAPVATEPVPGAIDPAGTPLVVDAVPAGRTAPARGACLRLTPVGGQAALELTAAPGSTIELRGAAGSTVDVRVRRFGDGFVDPPVAVVPPGQATRVSLPAADGAGARPWHLRLSSTAAVAVCPD